MPIQGKVGSLYTDESNETAFFPKTVTKAITDENNVRLDVLLGNMAT